MRWTYLLPRAILIGIVWAFFHYGFDPVLRRGMVYTGQRAARAKVEIAQLDTTFFAPTLKAANVQVADRKHPGTNLVEFSDLHAKLELQPLLKKNYIVEEASVSGLQWGTKRADSGLLPGEETDLSEDSNAKLLENIKHELLVRSKDWLAGLVDRAKLDFDPNQFETVRLGQELEERWPEEFGRYEDELNALKQRIDELRKSVKVKGGNELEKIERYGRAAQDVEQLLKELDQVKQQLTRTMRQAQDDLQALNEAKSNDIAKIKEKADLLRLDPSEITELLLGPELTNRLETAIAWAKFIRERIQLATDEPKPERFRGETILFPRKVELPLLLIRLLNVDGQGEFSGEQLAFKGSISGITTDPKIHRKPVIVRLDAVGQPFQADPNAPAAPSANGVQLVSAQAGKPDLLAVQLKAVLDYTKDVPEHHLLLSYKEPRPEERDIGKPESIQLAMTSRASNCVADLKLVGDELTGRIDYQQALESITAKLGTKRFKNDERVLAVIQDVVSGIHKIDAQMTLSGTALKPQFKLRSNLGHELSDGVNTAFSKQLEAGRRELLVRFEQESAKRSQKLTQLYDEQLEKLTGQLNLNKSDVQELAKSFGVKLPGKLDIKGIGALPIDPNKPLDLKGLGNVLPKPDAKLQKFGLQPETEPTPGIRQASDVENTIEDLGGLFGKKKKPAPKTVQPADGQQPKTK
ncbi:MAG: TIGR03545 family protein [Planctomycetaceae bacterium]